VCGPAQRPRTDPSWDKLRALPTRHGFRTIFGYTPWIARFTRPLQEPNMRSMKTSMNALRLTLLLASTSLCSTLTFAAPAAPQEQAGVDFSRSCRRIIHLRSGAIWTGVARLIEDRWQVKQNGDWIDIPRSEVLQAPKEAEVLQELKRRRSDCATSTEARLQLAKWCVAAGLYKETMTEVDAILEQHPNHKGTLSFLVSKPLIVVPHVTDGASNQAETRKQVLEFARNAPRAARELVFAEARKLEDQEALHSTLLEGLANKTSRQRSLCAHGLGRLFPGADSHRLLQHAVLDTSQEVRRAAAEALGAAERSELISPVVHALASSNPRVRVQAVQALGYMGYPAAIEPLVNYISVAAAASGEAPIPKGYIFTGKQTAYIQDYDVEVATFQAVADPQVNVLVQGQILEAGVAGSSELAFATTGRYVRSSLQRLTGLDAGNTARDWVRWWDSPGAQAIRQE
jgi:hypothetical protein